MPKRSKFAFQQRRIAREYGLSNVWPMWRAAKNAGVPFEVACALFEKESGGKNVWGNDVGGTFTDLPDSFRVNKDAYAVFRYYVVDLGRTSNGVGPAQITYRGFFPLMESQGLKPWRVYDNMLFGLRLLKGYFDTQGTWEKAGTRYNGSSDYGRDLKWRIGVWRSRLR